MTNVNEFPFFIFFTSKQSLYTPQIYSLVRKTSNFFAKQNVFLIINSSSITTDAGYLQQPKTFPIAKCLFMNTNLYRNFFDGQYHATLIWSVDNTLVSMVIMSL